MISVILPVYNGERYLREAIDSVLNQTFNEFELLILNDGSTDNTETIVKTYSDERIKYHKLRHKGLPSVLNYGLNEAKFDIVARMDADDVCHPERFEKQIQFLLNNQSIQLVGTNIAVIDKNGKVKGYGERPEFDKDIKEQLPYRCCIVHGSIIFWKKHILGVKGYNVGEVVEDWSLFLNLIDKINFHNFQEYLYYVRIHENNISSVNVTKNFMIAEEKLVQNYFLKITEGKTITNISNAKANFNLGYFYYYRDNKKFKGFFEKAFQLDKRNFRYIYFVIVGKYLRPLVLFARKTRLINLLIPLKKLDKNNLFFRSNF